MKEKKGISLKTKKILAGVGITFGTVIMFMVSFFIAFSLIVNPINFMTVGDAETAQENRDLKNQVQVLEDRIDVLNASVEKYKASANSQPIIIESQPTQTQTQNPGQTTNTQTGTEETGGGEDVPGGSDDQDFSPSTTTSTNEQTPEDVEVPITVIDITE